MYENTTYELLLERMLKKVKEQNADIDTREGSVIYNAIAPAAVELQNMYIQLDTVLRETFVDTAGRDHLVLRCAERGIYAEEATYAIRKGIFNIDVPIGSRFSLNTLNYEVTERISAGTFRLRCETAGQQGNTEYGNLIPIEYISGLQSAILSDVLVPGEDEEETDHLRKRYYDSLNAQAFGGNITDYRERVNALDGVGGVKVYPVWAGGGTVKLVIIDAAYGVPAGNLTDAVQAAVDPVGSQGQGAGIAPIGHVVTVQGVTGATVNIKTTLTYQDDWTWEDVRPYVEQEIDAYFAEMSREWADIDHIVVRISQIETRLLGLTGILDIADTSINGKAQNLELGPDSIPVRGTING